METLWCKKGSKYIKNRFDVNPKTGTYKVTTITFDPKLDHCVGVELHSESESEIDTAKIMLAIMALDFAPSCYVRKCKFKKWYDRKNKLTILKIYIKGEK
jgi:hypothetical protein